MTHERTLLDEFAMAALTGLLCYPDVRDGCSAEVFAKAAYDQAAAMLAEKLRREQKQV